MDREKVISNLQGVYEYLRHFENTAKMGEWVADALALLKEQEAVKPTWSRGKPFCGACGLRIHGGKFCSECGKPVLWEGR